MRSDFGNAFVRLRQNGEKSLDEVMDIIENRISIIMAENS